MSCKWKSGEDLAIKWIIKFTFFWLYNLWHKKISKSWCTEMKISFLPLILILDILFIMYHRRWRGGKGTEHDIRPSGNKIAQNDSLYVIDWQKKTPNVFYFMIISFYLWPFLLFMSYRILFFSFSLFSIKKEKWWSEMEINGNER